MTDPIGTHSDRTDPTAEERILAQWTGIYDAVYRHAGDRPDRDFAGFRSGLSGENYTDAEVIEWIDGTVAQVLALEREVGGDVPDGPGLAQAGVVPLRVGEVLQQACRTGSLVVDRRPHGIGLVCRHGAHGSSLR